MDYSINLISLLKKKGDVISRFLSAEELFISHFDFQESKNLLFLKNLDIFFLKRAQWIQTLAFYEKKIIDQLKKTFHISCREKEELRSLLFLQEKNSQTLLELDQFFLKKLTQKKLQIQDELFFIEKNRQFYNKFKSFWITEAGERLDHRL